MGFYEHALRIKAEARIVDLESKSKIMKKTLDTWQNKHLNCTNKN
jgi:hypothetical protein